MLRGALRRARLASCGRRARSSPSRARRCSSRARSRPRAGRAGAGPVRGAGRQEHAPGGADGRRGRGRGGRAQRAPRRGARSTAAADAGRQRARRGGRRRASRGASRAASTACSWTRPARASARCRPAPTCAGACSEDAVAEMAAPAGQILAAGAGALRPGGVLVYSTCTISPTENERLITAFLDSHADFALDDLAAELPESPPSTLRTGALPGTLLTLPHRDHTAGFFIARAAPELRPWRTSSEGAAKAADRPRPAVPELRRAVAAADQPPGPLPLRLLPAPLRADLGLPQLRRALDDRADVLDGDPEVQQLRRHRCCRPYERTTRRSCGERARRAVDPVRRLRPPARAGAARCWRPGARVIHVDVMDGHFVPPITMGPIVGRRARRARSRDAGAMLDVHLMIERPERQVGGLRARRRRLDHVPRRGDAAPGLRRQPDPRARAPASGVAINPGTPPRALDRAARRRSTSRSA